MSSKRSISVGVVLNIIASVLLHCISLITAPITTRLMDTAAYGVYSIFNSWVAIIQIVAGLQTYGTLTNARLRYSTAEYRHYVWNSLLLSTVFHIALVLLVMPFLSIFSVFFKLSPFLVLLIPLDSLFHCWIRFMNTELILDNDAPRNLLLSCVTIVTSFLLSYCFAVYTPCFAGKVHMAFIVGGVISRALTGGFCFIWFMRHGLSFPNGGFAVYCLGLSIPLVFHGIAGFVLGQSDRLMLNEMIGESEAGLYSFTYSFAGIVSSLWATINGIWVPFYFRYLQAGDIRELRRHVRNFDALYLTLLGGFLLLYPEVFRLLANNRYWSGMALIPILCLGFFFEHLYGFPANYEYYREKTIYSSIASVLAACSNIVLNFLLIPKWAGLGAAIATSISFCFMYLFHSFTARNIVRDYPLPLSGDGRRIACALFFLAANNFLYNVPVLRWLLGATLGCMELHRVYKHKELI